jgi:hypothetical protein
MSGLLRLFGVLFFVSLSLMAESQRGAKVVYFPLCQGILFEKGYTPTQVDHGGIRRAVNSGGEEMQLRFVDDPEDRKAHIKLLNMLKPLMRAPDKAGFVLSYIREIPDTAYLESPVVPGVSAWDNLDLYAANLRKFAAVLRQNFTTDQSDFERDPLAWVIRLYDKASKEFLGQLIITPSYEHVIYDPETGSMTLNLDVSIIEESFDNVPSDL